MTPWLTKRPTHRSSRQRLRPPHPPPTRRVRIADPRPAEWPWRSRRLASPRLVPAAVPGGRKFFRRKKVCKFCTEKIDAISYRDVRLLQGFVAERGKIVPRRLTGVCTRHQRRLSLAIKQSRNIALLAFANRF